MRPALAVPLGLAAAGTAAAVYGWGYERKAFKLRQYDVPVLPAGSPDLTVLHISDIHATPGQPWKVDWIRSLAELEPDLVIDTGDNLASRRGVPVVLDALGPLLDRPGAFVPGSNDWFAPTLKNPARYLLPDTGERHSGEPLPWGELRSEFTDAGWLDLTHRRQTLELRGVTVEVGGVSDAHMRADHYDRIAGPTTADVGIGLSHSPEPRVLDAFAADGVLDRQFALAEINPVLRFPAAQAISFHFIDYLVHGWDVARSLGADYQPEPDLLAAALPVAQAVPGGEARKRDGAAFAPEVAVPEQAGLLDQILAMLGRDPSWSQ